MPAIETVAVPRYQPLDPYHHIVDNLPIDGLVERVFLVNNQVDNNTAILSESIGTAGSLANRLNQALNPDGTIITQAIDNALHSIEDHLDSNNFVRMTLDERIKLSFISPGATALQINVDVISGTIPFIDDTLTFGASDTVTWNYVSGKIIAEIDFPTSIRHNHYYNIIPVTSDNQNYTTTVLSTPYKEDSLRVHVNGVKLNNLNLTYVPIGMPSVITWTPLSFSEGSAISGTVIGGDFSLNAPIASAARVVIDFDVLYT